MENSFGKNLKSIREARNLSQDEFSNLLGTSKQVISRYENSQRTPKITTVQEYAQKLGVSIGELTGYDVEEFRDFLNEASEHYNKGNGIEDIKLIYQLILNNKGKIYLIEQLILLLNAPVFLEDYNLSDKFDADSVKLHINKLLKAKDELAKEGGE